jgi:putative Mn2+ efflux pump MntP
MPLVGWLAGLSLTEYISGIDHWIAFALLTFIGCKMIYESTRLKPNEKNINPLNFYVLLLLSIATSIDALAVGVSFAFLQVAIATPIIIIGTITFALSFLGVFIGDISGYLFENKIEIAGGLILIGIGTKILLEHLI